MKKSFTVRLTTEAYEKLKALADSESRSMSNMLNIIIMRATIEKKKEGKEK